MRDKTVQHSTWVTVDLQAIKDNVRNVLERSGVEVMAVVKARAYGHGAANVARAAIEAGASWCGVGRLSEALELRQAGLDCRILLLGYTPEARYAEAISNDVSMTVWDSEQLELVSAAAVESGKTAGLHLKVDTGMSRLGAAPNEILGLIHLCQQLPNLHLEGLFTHFARADESEPLTTDRQNNSFKVLLTELDSAGISISLIHAANSAAGLTRPDTHFNCVRLGMAMYGLDPSPECPVPSSFRPALAWKSVLSMVKVLPPGQGVSYGHEYTTSTEERIGTVAVGYADGYRRSKGNQVLINGKRVPVIGRICMDQIMVQLDGVPEAKVGDEVVLIGVQGAEEITADEVAGVWGTNNYEVICAIGARVPRLAI